MDNPETGLTDKQERFCQEYLIDLNGTQAAIRAGYSEDSAPSIACENFIKPNVQARLAELKSERSKRCQISIDDVVLELKRVGFSNMSNFAKWDGDDVTFRCSEELTEDQSRCVESISQTVTKEGGSHSLRLHPKVKALELLGEHLGMFPKNVNLGGQKDNPLFTQYTDEQKAAMADALDALDAAGVNNAGHS